MQPFKNKSSINAAAAQVLEEKTYYAPAIHCLYYSCLQRIIQILISVFGKKAKELESQIHQSGSSHNEYINSIVKDLKNLDNKDLNEFNTEYKKLKKLRVKADYHDSIIAINDFEVSRNSQEAVFKILKKHYNI